MGGTAPGSRVRWVSSGSRSSYWLFGSFPIAGESAVGTEPLKLQPPFRALCAAPLHVVAGELGAETSQY